MNFVCCDEETITETNTGDSEEIESFWDATDSTVDTEKVTESKLWKYIIKQKDEIICELRDRIILLEKYVGFLEGNQKSRKSICSKKRPR